MGLDAVEIVLRTEELFAITIGDDEAAAVRNGVTSDRPTTGF
jgi:acyl carrier protein